MKIVFWNINKKRILPELEAMAQDIDPDILFLAECDIPISETLSAVNKKKVAYFLNLDPICTKIQMYSKFKDKLVRPITSGLRFTVRSIKIPNFASFQLMVLHFQSKRNWDSNDQAAHSAEMKQIITRFEKKSKIARTIVMGDFNMNPFDHGIVQTTGFHAVMSKEVALKKSRIVDGQEYPFFYNPMWAFYGDSGKGTVNGTTYNILSKPINYFWNIFDQILIRPEMLPYIDENSIEIIKELNSTKSLLTSSNIVDDTISDHLPIVIQIKPI